MRRKSRQATISEFDDLSFDEDEEVKKINMDKFDAFKFKVDLPNDAIYFKKQTKTVKYYKQNYITKHDVFNSKTPSSLMRQLDRPMSLMMKYSPSSNNNYLKYKIYR